MAIALRALKTFMGRPGEVGPDKLVHMGSDFIVADRRRADYLERKGWAVPLIQARAKMELSVQNKMEPPVENKAAQSGPLPSAGGETGGASAPSLLGPVPVRVRRPSRKREGEPDSSL